MTERPRGSKEIVSNLVREQDKLASNAAAMAVPLNSDITSGVGDQSLFPGANLLGYGAEYNQGIEHVIALENMLKRATEK